MSFRALEQVEELLSGEAGIFNDVVERPFCDRLVVRHDHGRLGEVEQSFTPTDVGVPRSKNEVETVTVTAVGRNSGLHHQSNDSPVAHRPPTSHPVETARLRPTARSRHPLGTARLYAAVTN